MQHEGRRQGDPGALAGHDHVGMIFPGIETLEAAAQPDAGVAGHDSGPSAGRCGDHVAEAVGDQAGRRVVSVGERWRDVPPRGVGGRVEHRLPGSRVARAALERGMFGVDQFAAQSGVLGREQARERDIGEMGVGVVRVAIGEGQLERFGDRVDCIGAVMPHRLQVEAVEDLQGLEQRRALGPDAALVDGQSAIGDRDRFFEPGGVRGEIDVTDQRAFLFRPGVDAPGDRSAVERVGDQAEPARAVGLRRAFLGGTMAGRCFGGFEQFERAEQVGMPGLGPWAVFQELFRGSDHLSEGHGAEAVEQSQAGVERGRDGCGLDSLGGDSARAS